MMKIPALVPTAAALGVLALLSGMALAAGPANEPPDTPPGVESTDADASPGPGDEVGAEPQIATTPSPLPRRAKPKVIDFGEEEGFGVGEVMVTQDPRPLKHKSLLRKRYQGPDPGTVARIETAAPAPARAFGVKAGFNIAGFGGPGAAATSSRFGGMVGVFLSYGVTSRLAVQPEVQLNMKGVVTDPDSESTRLNYITIPILARVKWDVGRTEVAIASGPSLGVALTDRAGQADIERLDLGAVLALGVAVPAGAARLVLDARYEHGLVKATGTGDDNRAIRNRVASLSVGYLF